MKKTQKQNNIVPIQKKGDKQTVRNYRPISLLPICGKIFERFLNHQMLNFFSKNSSGSPEQSGFRPGDSCINQLLSINHETNSKCFRVSDIPNDLKSGFPLVDFFRTNGLFSSLIHRIRQ